MDFQLTEAQTDIRDGIRRQCAGRFPVDKLRAGTGLWFWSELVEAGVFSLRTDPSQDGSGLGMAEAALVFEELGRGLVPGPAIWTHLAAGLEDPPAADSIVGGLSDRGTPAVIEHLDAIDELFVLDDDGVWLVDPAEMSASPGDPLDPMTPVSIVDTLPLGRQVADARVAARWRLEGAVLVAAQLAGMASALVDLTVSYTKERKQFGRPVGSFQALKHTMADMLTRAELARTQVYAAALHLDDPTLPGTARSVSAAKVVASRAALVNGAKSIQCHGGMGYTWEIDSHLYLKRAWVLDPMFGSADDHALAMAGYLEEES